MQRLFLILSASLFLVWLSWLTYQAMTESDPVVVSRPQIEVAEIIAVADLDTPANQHVQVTVKQVLKGKLPNQGNAPFTIQWPDRICGWQGPGTYLLALKKDGKELEAIPDSPGFHGLDRTDFQGRKHETMPVRHVIYPWSESVKQQVESIVKRQGN